MNEKPRPNCTTEFCFYGFMNYNDVHWDVFKHVKDGRETVFSNEANGLWNKKKEYVRATCDDVNVSCYLGTFLNLFNVF